jgi:putative ABC transport system ATP-binding protein
MRHVYLFKFSGQGYHLSAMMTLPTPKPDRSENTFLNLDNISKAYHEAGRTRTVLKDMSISIAKGEYIAVLGKSGTGKTTLLNLISGIDRPDQGAIHLNGEILTDMNDRDRTLFRRRNIGFIFQFYNLIPTLTVWENVILPLELNGMTAPDDLERARTLLMNVDLLDRIKTFPDRLSGGEQQRVAIARSLVHNPQIVLADEPTGNLDEERGSQIMQMLNQLTRKAGKILILVTHNQESANFADRVYVLQDGKLQVRY